MSLLLERFVQYLSQQNWHFEARPDRSLTMTVTAKHCKFGCVLQSIARLGREIGLFYSVLPQFVPPDRRLDTAEFLMRANHGLVVGNFEMDFDTGEVRYKTNMIAAPNALDDELIEALLHTNISTHDRYVPGMMQVIYGGLSPTEACKRVEIGDLH